MRPYHLFIGSIALSAPSFAGPIPVSDSLSQTIISNAGGGVPVGNSAIQLSDDGISGFQVANFLENVEAAFFAAAQSNLTKDAAFTATPAKGLSISDTLTKIVAQEQVHVATVENLLASNNAFTIPACTSILPIGNNNNFLAKANIITSASIGAVVSLSAALAKSDPDAVSSVTPILSVESRHDAFFRISSSDVPNPNPFDTALSATYAYNIILSFVDTSSCPKLLPLPILPALNITSPALTAAAPSTPPTTISFTIGDMSAEKSAALFIGWLNQANAPVYTAATVMGGKGTADVPKGLTGMAFAALTNQSTGLTLDDLTSNTLAGPAAVLIS
jgi:hypothetical protein